MLEFFNGNLNDLISGDPALIYSTYDSTSINPI